MPKYDPIIAETGNHTAAAKRAGINRKTLYKWVEKYPDFKEAYNQALEISIDLLELEARNRATKGAKEPVYYKGKVVGHVHKPSDRLMELLLRAHLPDKYSDRQQIDLNATFTVEIATFAAPSAGVVIESSAVQSVSSSTVLLPGGEGVEGQEGGTPKSLQSPIGEGIDIADFSDIFSES